MKKLFTLLFIFIGFIGLSHAQTIYYVKLSSDIKAWEGRDNVYTDIQEAIDAAASNNSEINSQIWIAQGEYILDNALVPKSGVDVIGGFSGSENNVSERSFVGQGLNTTILSGGEKVQVINQKEALSTPTTWTNLIICNGAGAIDGGGAALNTNMTLKGSIIKDNRAAITGGGVLLKGNSRLINCLVTNNMLLNNNSVSGSGVYCEGSSQIINCTIVKNSSMSNTIYGEGIYATGSSFIGNSIVWGNITYYAYAGTVQIFLNEQAQASYCAVTNGCDGGDNIITIDGLNEGGYTYQGPLFIDPESDWNLQIDSPCINVGNNDLSTPADSVDLNGKMRIDGGTIDLGAFEYIEDNSSVEVIESAPSLHVYPNPCSDFLYLDFDYDSYCNIRITSVSGVLLYETTLNGDSSINLSNLPKGYCILSWSTNKGSGSIPLILK